MSVYEQGFWNLYFRFSSLFRTTPGRLVLAIATSIIIVNLWVSHPILAVILFLLNFNTWAKSHDNV